MTVINIKELLIERLKSLNIEDAYIPVIIQCLPTLDSMIKFLSWIIEMEKKGYELRFEELILKAGSMDYMENQSFDQEEVIESDHALTDIQHLYLRRMYLMGLTPGAKPCQSSKIIADIMSVYIDIYSDSISEHIEDFYALAQPWVIDDPLIECLGNIGSPVLIDLEYSGAASPLFTEAVLTEAGVKYIIEHEVMNMVFAL